MDPPSQTAPRTNTSRCAGEANRVLPIKTKERPFAEGDSGISSEITCFNSGARYYYYGERRYDH